MDWNLTISSDISPKHYTSGGIVIFLGLSVTQNENKMSFGFMKEWGQQQCIALTIDDQCYKTVDMPIINIRPRL